MKMIQKIVEQIDDEIDGAEEYFRYAKEYKTDYPTISSKYYEMAQQELTHVDNLHIMVANIINQQKQKDIEGPKEMLAIWEWEHEKYIEEVDELKYKMNLYKNS